MRDQLDTAGHLWNVSEANSVAPVVDPRARWYCICDMLLVRIGYANGLLTVLMWERTNEYRRSFGVFGLSPLSVPTLSYSIRSQSIASTP